MEAIQVQDVHKTYRGKVHALRGVSLDVMEGEIFGLLGPNGAGKSTLVKILMTVIHASNISLLFNGQSSLTPLRCNVKNCSCNTH
ncbi:MAG: ATP-binding cassette domain-containing protein [Phycisphaerales bacterium]